MTFPGNIVYFLKEILLPNQSGDFISRLQLVHFLLRILLKLPIGLPHLGQGVFINQR